MNEITLNAPCKVNLFLEITGTLPNGYHEIESIFHTIDLQDVVTVTLIPNLPVEVAMDGLAGVAPEDNIVYKAAREFCQHANIDFHGFSISIIKNIPSQAGLGGGSADAAATLKGLNHLLKANLPTTQLMDIGAKVGADVPFCIKGGTSLVKGFGENILPIDFKPKAKHWWVVCKPLQGVSTIDAFVQYDQLRIKPNRSVGAMLSALESADLASIGSCMYNVFEHLTNIDQTTKIKAQMARHGSLGSVLSGSGSAVVGLFHNHASATSCYNKLKELYGDVFLCN